MRSLASYLDWIDGQQGRMSRLTAEWAEINSGSHNVPGLAKLSAAVMRELERLGAVAHALDLPPQELPGSNGQAELRPLGQAISVVKRPTAPLRILLGIHLDTVYAADSPFQKTTLLDGDRLQGPGVADAKGGLVVLLTALEALERSPLATEIGWEILLNPDEELGSPGSAPLFEAAAKRNHLGLLFEPAMEDGALVAARKGSGNFTAVVTGRSAHAGRNPHHGRNAIHALAQFITKLAGSALPEVSVNVGQIEGGTAANVVPDRALCRFNIRVVSVQQQHEMEQRLRGIVAEINRIDGIALQLSGAFTAPPKPLDESTRSLLAYTAECGRELGVPIHWRNSGGVSDGNRLAAAGLANIDSLGVRGGAIHSPEEFVLLDSLAERAKLSALLLMRLAAGDLTWPPVAAPKETEVAHG